MRAVYLEAHGGLDALVAGELADPRPGPGEVVVRVKACALNRLDLWVRQGWPGLALRFPHVLGADVAGVVEEVGPGVATAAAGDEVVVNPGTSCGQCEACLGGRDNLCPRYALLGEHVDGGYAERVRVPAANLCPRPACLSWSEAAAVPLVFLTAWQMLVDRAAVRPGETVLVHGGGSGVGSAAIQVARLLNATVITTASSDDKLERAREIGAHHGVRYDRPGWSQEVRDRAGGRGVDVVVEHTGAPTFADSVRLVRRGGRVVTCGATGGADARLDLRVVFYRQVSILGSTMAPKARLYDILRHVEAGALRPVLDRTFPLEEARQAQRTLEERRQFGKLVLLP